MTGRGSTEPLPSVYVPSVINRFNFGYGVVTYFIMQSSFEKISKKKKKRKKKKKKKHPVFLLSEEIRRPPSCLF